MAATPSLIFITGGVRSGKSSFAEGVATQLAAENGGQLYYLATGIPIDSEMQKRIQKHRQDRKKGSFHWQTVEQSARIDEVAGIFTGRDIILLDCVTTLLNNELYSSEGKWDESFLKTIQKRILAGIRKIKERAQTMILVSNEVLNEPLPETELIFTYGKLLGEIHQQLVQLADQAFLVEAGIPILMKGDKV